MSASGFNPMAQRRASSGTGASVRFGGTRPASYATGRVLAGRYRIERLIGMGAMGVVLAARHLGLETRVAIKAILPEMQNIPGALSLFEREAKAAVTIHSEHVAQVFDVGTDDDLGPYIVMEYLEGRDLRAVLELEGPIPLRRAIDYVLQACEAAAAAHAQGVIHRDIKPENLFLTRQGDLEIVKLLDFGVSKAAITRRLVNSATSAWETAGFMGTPLYMSPEQIHLRTQVDHRADIWSLGAVLYELVTGHSAFSSKDGMPALLTSICEAAPPLLSEYCSGPEACLQGVVDQCLDKNPARRFQNVAELAYALVPFAASRSRLHAQRAGFILGTRAEAEAAPMSAQVRPLPQPTAAPRVTSRRFPARPPWLVGALVVGALILGARTFSSPGKRAEWIQAFRSAAGIESTQEALTPRPAPRPAVAARTVNIESQPNGALVSIDGHMLGVTPLSTQLPPGTVVLSLTKPGYSEAQQVLQTDLAELEAPPLSVRTALRRAVVERSAKAQALAKRVERALLDKPSSVAPRRAKSQSSPTAQSKPNQPLSAGPEGASVTPAASREPRLRLVEDEVPPRSGR